MILLKLAMLAKSQELPVTTDFMAWAPPRQVSTKASRRRQQGGDWAVLTNGEAALADASSIPARSPRAIYESRALSSPSCGVVGCCTRALPAMQVSLHPPSVGRMLARAAHGDVLGKAGSARKTLTD